MFTAQATAQLTLSRNELASARHQRTQADERVRSIQAELRALQKAHAAQQARDEAQQQAQQQVLEDAALQQPAAQHLAQELQSDGRLVQQRAVSSDAAVQVAPRASEQPEALASLLRLLLNLSDSRPSPLAWALTKWHAFCWHEMAEDDRAAHAAQLASEMLTRSAEAHVWEAELRALEAEAVREITRQALRAADAVGQRRLAESELRRATMPLALQVVTPLLRRHTFHRSLRVMTTYCSRCLPLYHRSASCYHYVPIILSPRLSGGDVEIARRAADGERYAPTGGTEADQGK